jgi:hypothetical protein
MMKQRAAAADLSGGNASEASLTPRSVNSAAEYAMDLTVGLLLVALSSAVSSEVFVRPRFPFLKMDWKRLEAGFRSELCKGG